jgi:MFS family permease
MFRQWPVGHEQPRAPMAHMMVARAAGKRLSGVLGFAAMPILWAPIPRPVIAGAIPHFASWRWLLLVNSPFVLLALLLAVRRETALKGQIGTKIRLIEISAPEDQNQ